MQNLALLSRCAGANTEASFLLLHLWCTNCKTYFINYALHSICIYELYYHMNTLLSGLMSISSISSWWALKFNFSFKEGYWEGNKWLTLISSNQLKWLWVLQGKAHLPHSHVTVRSSREKKLQVRAEAHTLLKRVLGAEVWLHLPNFVH